MSTAPSIGVVARDPSSFVLRRVLPLIVTIVGVIGVVRWAATDAGLISELAGVVVMTGVAIALCIGYSLWLARVMRRSAATQRDALYRLVGSNIPNGAVFLFDRDLRFVLAEGSNFGEVSLKPEDLEGRTIWEALAPEVAASVESSYRAALAGERTTFETVSRGQDYLVTVAPTFDDSGEIVGGVVHSQQITE